MSQNAKSRATTIATPATKPGPNPVPKPKVVYMVLYEGVQILDVSGPAEVLSQANREVGFVAYQLHFVSSSPQGLVTSSCGLPLQATALPEANTTIDLLIVPGADFEPLQAVTDDAILMTWLAQACQQTRVNASVCTGAFLLGQLGLLDNRRVTTHWLGTEALQAGFPKARVENKTLYTHEDDLWTSAGVLSGIDMMLAMVSQDLGAQIALRIARVLVVFLFRDGGQSQFSEAIDLQARAQQGEIVHLIAWLEGRLHQPITVSLMAEQLATSVRSLHRRCQQSLAMTPAQLLSELRLERSRKLLQKKNIAIKSIAFDCGFSHSAAYSKAFRARFGIAPTFYRQHFQEQQPA